MNWLVLKFVNITKPIIAIIAISYHKEKILDQVIVFSTQYSIGNDIIVYVFVSSYSLLMIPFVFNGKQRIDDVACLVGNLAAYLYEYLVLRIYLEANGIKTFFIILTCSNMYY